MSQHTLRLSECEFIRQSWYFLSQVKLHHPTSDDLAFLYGTILTDGKDQYSEEATANVCVFAEAQVSWCDVCLLLRNHLTFRTDQTQAASFWFSQVDRSPTGSGVTARVALQYHKGLIQLGQTRTFQSGATGSQFTGRAVQVAPPFIYIR